MAIIKCKMCGGDLNLVAGSSTAECQYCGSLQTIPQQDDEKKLLQFERAERLRKQCEFDKAAGIYETIVADFRQESEAYWGLVLCKYGIEYVDDPGTGKKIPTCHRSSFESILKDPDFEQALENADSVARRVYREEAKRIEELRKGIVEVSSNEQPYDIFICYKETAENGNRTLDSVLAQDVYDALTDKGYRVFFSRITLEDKLGVEYEPYIFAALNSAKIMLAFGTDYEYYNAVWVKNEWSRFLKLMTKDKSKHLIPCYKGIDAYDMPEEFAKFQAQDMGKVGALQDLLRGIEKLLPKKQEQPMRETVVVQQASANSTEPLLKRANLFLEDKKWQEANEYAERVLDQDPENAEGYLVKLLAALQVTNRNALSALKNSFDDRDAYQKALRFGDHRLKQFLQEANKIARCNGIYEAAKQKMNAASTIRAYTQAAEMFDNISPHQDAAVQAKRCREAAEQLCIKQKKEEAAAAARKKKRNRILRIIALIILLDIAAYFVVMHWLIPASHYRKAEALFGEGKYLEAAEAFAAVGHYRDAAERASACHYTLAEKLLEEEKTAEAAIAFGKTGIYSDARERSLALWEEVAVRETISAGYTHTVGLKADGTVVAVGDNDEGQCEGFVWRDIVAISSGRFHTVGLKADGTVVAVGWNDYGQCDVSDWTNIVAISSGRFHTVGLKADGTVVAVGDNDDGQCDVSDWTNIVAISSGYYQTVGLKADGTVVAVGYNTSGQCDVSDWTNIVAISAGYYHTVGLKADGTVVAVGDNDFGQCGVSDWTNIVAISAGGYHTVGLKADGTVVAVGWNDHGQCEVSGWRDIVAISAGVDHTVGLKADGTVVAVGWNDDGQCEVSDWTDIKQPKQ